MRIVRIRGTSARCRRAASSVFVPAALQALERTALVAGLLIAGWWGVRLLELYYFERLTAPGPAAVQRIAELPGEPARPPAQRARRGEWLARLEAPSARLSVTVVEGSGDAELARSAGHIEETARPGEAGNIGIAGHRDTTFRPLRRLRIGDALLLTTRGHVQEFRVSRLWIVEPRDVHVLHPTGRTTLTLVTCYPFGFVGRAPQRYIVRADLVGARGRTAAASPAAPGSRG